MTRIPQHIAIIMDGNGRWATERGKDRSYGHQAGVDAVRRITAECTRLGVKYLTLYTFSTENWNRPETEIHALMGLVLTSLEDEIFMKNNVRFRVIGDVKRLPQEVQDKLHETEEHTKHNDTMTMVVALSYSSRWEITKAVKDIIEERTKPASCAEQQPESTRVQRSESTDITEQVISQHLETSFMPDPDLLIRTGGEPAHQQLPVVADSLQRACTSATLTGPTSARRTSTRPSLPIRAASAVTGRQRHR